MRLSDTQLIWLSQRGGRTEADVCGDDGGLYVLMSAPLAVSKTERVYLPQQV